MSRTYKVQPNLARILTLALTGDPMRDAVERWRQQLEHDTLDEAGRETFKALGWLTERDGRLEPEHDPRHGLHDGQRTLEEAATPAMPGARPGPRPISSRSATHRAAAEAAEAMPTPMPRAAQEADESS